MVLTACVQEGGRQASHWPRGILLLLLHDDLFARPRRSVCQSFCWPWHRDCTAVASLRTSERRQWASTTLAPAPPLREGLHSIAMQAAAPLLLLAAMLPLLLRGLLPPRPTLPA